MFPTLTKFSIKYVALSMQEVSVHLEFRLT